MLEAMRAMSAKRAMRANVGLAWLVVATACASTTTDPGPASPPIAGDGRGSAPTATSGDATAVMMTVEIDGGVDVDAAPVAMGAPADLAALPELGAAGPRGSLIVHAADAHASHLRRALARAARIDVIERSLPQVRITGRFGPGTESHLGNVLARGVAGLSAQRVGRAGKAVTVDLDFTSASPTDLFRLAADILGTSIVIGAAEVPDLDVQARRLRADHLVEVMAERLGWLRERHGNLTWLRSADGVALDRALLAYKRGARITIDVNGARASEVYALLARFGTVAGGASCDGGAAMTFRVRDVQVGAVLAIAAALSGQAPAPGVACAPIESVASFRDLELRATAAMGTRRVAVFRGTGGLLVTARGEPLGEGTVTEVGAGFVTVAETVAGGEPRETSIVLHRAEVVADGAPWAAAPGPVSASLDADRRVAELERVVRDGRLAATVVDGASSQALFELPQDGWYLVDGHTLRGLPPETFAIEPGKVVYRFASFDPLSPPRTGEAVLRPSR